MPSALSLSLILYDMSLQLCSELGILVLFGLFANGFMRFMNFRCRKKDIVLLCGLLLSYVVVKLASIVPISHFHQVMKKKIAKLEPVPTTSFEYFKSYLVDFVGNCTSILRNHMFTCYANLTLPEYGHFRFS